MTDPEVTPTETTSSGSDWSLLTTFASAIAIALVFIAWLLMGAGNSGSTD